MSLNGSNYKGYERAFCVRMKSTLTKRGCHFKSSGYRVSWQQKELILIFDSSWHALKWLQHWSKPLNQVNINWPKSNSLTYCFFRRWFYCFVIFDLNTHLVTQKSPNHNCLAWLPLPSLYHRHPLTRFDWSAICSSPESTLTLGFHIANQSKENYFFNRKSWSLAYSKFFGR